MAVTVKNVVCCLGLLSLCFVGIPVRVKEPDAVELEFQEFIQKHNRSYANEPTEYAKRLEYFKVGASFTSINPLKHINVSLYLFSHRRAVIELHTITPNMVIVVKQCLVSPSFQILNLKNFKRCC